MKPIQLLLNLLLDKQDEFEIERRNPAGEGEIAAFEAALQLTLPADIRAFYKVCNGFETADFLFQILPLKQIQDDFLTYGMGTAGQRFGLAEYLIYSDTWEVVLDPASATGYYITNADHGSGAPVVLTDSILAFACRYLEGTGVFGERGLYEWLAERRGA